MKRILFAALAALMVMTMSAEAKNVKVKLQTVVYCTDIDCENCAKKIRENVSFEKGVRDLKVDVPAKTVEIQFDPARTDTLQLKKAIKNLGYEAKVVKFD